MIKQTVEENKTIKRHINYQNMVNMKEVAEFLELDTMRYQFKKEQHKKLKARSPELAAKYAQNSGIEGLLKGKNQYHPHGFHSLLAQKFDQKKERTTVQKLHQQIKNSESKRSVQHTLMNQTQQSRQSIISMVSQQNEPLDIVANNTNYTIGVFPQALMNQEGFSTMYNDS